MPLILHFLIFWGCHVLIISVRLFFLTTYLRLYSLRLGRPRLPLRLRLLTVYLFR